jgi:two-component system sensor histidine kinase DegS
MAIGYLGAAWSSHTEPGYWASISTRTFFLLVLGTLARRISGNREHRARELMRLQEQVAASEERARIAREIHDGLGHALVASILRLELCSWLIRKEPEEAERILQSEVPALRAAWNEGRDMAFHLRPWEREGRGFIETLRRHIGRFAERTGIAVDLDADDESWELPPDIEMTATRIIQEALTNIAKHARAKQASVCVDYEFGKLHCVIKDDGVGFEADAASGSFGLYAMQDRAERCGGTLRVQSRPGEGTTIDLVIPA